jgi:hypothetical protein
MRKTRKNLPKNKYPMHANTSDSLVDWSRHLHENLGWMVISKAKGIDYKILDYKNSIDHLILSIEHVMTEYKDPDRIHDLTVLHMRTTCLQDFVKKTL